MKIHFLLLLFLALPFKNFGQYTFDPSPEHIFGLPNPEAPTQLLDFAPLIGECDCKSVRRNPDQSWGDPVDMIWRFKYIMNGMAVQDETLKADGKHSGSIRQFSKDSTKWYVHYYSSTTPSRTLPVWEGNKNEEGKIVLYREQKAPNGMDGFYKISFYDISEEGFKWLGEWVTPDESISFPTWKIDCKSRQGKTSDEERLKIINATKEFSKAYMNADYETMAEAYTENAKIFPSNAKIIEGRTAIKERWVLPEGVKILHHEIQPEAIRFIGDLAYDYGYYEGKTQTAEGKIVPWKGKYVVIWQKENGRWKMFLDIWNRVAL